MTHAPGRGRNDPTLITMNNLTRDLRLAETERDRIKAVNAEMAAVLGAIANIADNEDRDRYGRPVRFSCAAQEQMRVLMQKYNASNGGRDFWDQIAFVARAAIANARGD